MPIVLIHCKPPRVRRSRRRMINGDGSVRCAPEVDCSCLHGPRTRLAALVDQVPTYDPAGVAAYYDRLGDAAWNRFDQTLGDRISLALHTEAVERAVPHASRVLEIGAGPGRFTEVLHGLGCRITVGDLSATQLDLNRQHADARGFAASIEARHQLDICDLSRFGEASFDAVVALGGPLSYVFDQRDRAVAECRRVLRPGGVLLASVMSLWGAAHRHLSDVLALGSAASDDVVHSGDVNTMTVPGSTHPCHRFRANELRDLLERHNLTDIEVSASSALSTGIPASLVAPGTQQWTTLLALERAACAEPGYRDAGTHLIAVARRPSAST